MAKRSEKIKKEMRKKANKIWLKSIPLVVALYIAMVLLLYISGNGIMIAGFKTVAYFILVFAGIIIGHKITIFAVRKSMLLYIPEEKRDMGELEDLTDKYDSKSNSEEE